MRKATTNPSDDKLNSILSAYNAGADNEVLELELAVPEHRRASPDWEDTWSTLVMKAANEAEMVTFYTDTRIYQADVKKGNNDYLVRIWNNGVKANKMTQLVKKTIDGADYQGLTLRLSSEANYDYESTNLGNRNMIRIRSRMTVIPKWASNWKMDFTRSEVVPRGNREAIEGAYEALFSKTTLTPVDYVNRAKAISKTDIRQRLQLEMEWVGETLTLEELNNTANSFRNFLRGMASVDTPYYKAIMWLAKRLNRKIPPQSSLKQLAVSVKSLTRKIYNDVLETVSDWVVTEKADGERAWLVIAPTDFIDGNKLAMYLVHHELVALDWKVPKDTEITILDGEWVKDKFWMFDAIEVNNKDVTNTTLTTRLETAIPVAKLIGVEIKNQTNLSDGHVIGMKVLKATKTPTTADTIQKVMNAKYAYKLDGLIFTQVSSHYWGPQKPIKWKSPEQTTIDFLVIKAPDEALKSASYPPKKDYTVMFLFCGVRKTELQELKLTPFAYYQSCIQGLNISKSPEALIPIQFSPLQDSMAYVYYHPNSHAIPIAQVHQHVGEFKYELKTKTWHLERLRPDRDVDVMRGVGFGNKFTPTAVDVFQGIQDPFTFEELLKPRVEGVSYFQVDKDPRWRAITHYNNFVKSRIIMQLANARWVLDGCCGKGQDLLKYTSLQIPNIIMMDQDQAALNEIQGRIGWIHDPKQNKFGMRPPPPNYIPKIHVRKVDMSDFARVPKEVKSIPGTPDKIDAIVMNFCIHYFIDSSKSAHEFAKMASQLLDKNGLLIFTLFNGDVIRKIMADYDKGDIWEVENSEIYKIKMLQVLPEVLDFGYKIGVMHPFSGSQFIEEYLVPMRKLNIILEGAGFIRLQGGSFGDWHNSYEAMKDKKTLEKPDKIYSSLYHYYSYCYVGKV